MRVRGASKDRNLSIQSIAAGLAVAVSCAKQPATIQRTGQTNRKDGKCNGMLTNSIFLQRGVISLNFGTIMYLTYRCNPDSASSGTSAFTACAVRITYKYIVCCRILSQPDTGGLLPAERQKTRKQRSLQPGGSELSAVSGPSCWKPWAMTLSVGMFRGSCGTNYVEAFADPQRAAGTQQYHPMLWIFHPKERRQGILSEIRESF